MHRITSLKHQSVCLYLSIILNLHVGKCSVITKVKLIVVKGHFLFLRWTSAFNRDDVTCEGHVQQRSVPPAVQRKQKTLRAQTPPPPRPRLVFRAGKKPKPGQDFNSRVTKHVSIMAERLRSTLSLTGSFLMLAASELWSTWYGAHTD